MCVCVCVVGGDGGRCASGVGGGSSGTALYSMK